MRLSEQDRRHTMQRHWAHDGMHAYRQRLDALVRPGMRILHLGCGRDKAGVTRPYKDRCEVVGLDPDPSAGKRFHSAFVRGKAEAIPFEDARFDLVASEYVIEHVERPERAFAEIGRVLKPGGHTLALAPNRYSYKSLAASATPHALHQWLNKRLRGFDEADIYPTVYRANTPRRLRELARASGLQAVDVRLINNGPTWFVKLPVVFELFHLFHLAMNRYEALGPLRCALLFEAQKPEAAPDVHADASTSDVRLERAEG